MNNRFITVFCNARTRERCSQPVSSIAIGKPGPGLSQDKTGPLKFSQVSESVNFPVNHIPYKLDTKQIQSVFKIIKLERTVFTRIFFLFLYIFFYNKRELYIDTLVIYTGTIHVKTWHTRMPCQNTHKQSLSLFHTVVVLRQ